MLFRSPIELHRRFPELPLFCDPSHIGGKRELIAPLSQQAMDLQFNGLIIESHCTPNNAWSDKDQQVSPEVLDVILRKLVIREMKQSTEDLVDLRHEIDDLDNTLLETLAKRMRVSQNIGIYKKEHGISVLQTGRYNEILEKRIANGEKLGMSREFMRTFLEAIHEESVRVQVELMNND